MNDNGHYEPTRMKLIFKERNEVDACHALKRYLRDVLGFKNITVQPYSGDVTCYFGEEYLAWTILATS